MGGIDFHRLSGSHDSCASNTSSAGTPVNYQPNGVCIVLWTLTFFLHEFLDLLQGFASLGRDLLRDQRGDADCVHDEG